MHRLRKLSKVNGCRCSSRNSASSSLCTINFSTSSRAQRRGFYYELLDVPTSADATQIKDAYYNKCKQLHPDRNLDGDTNAKFQQLKQAYDVLSRPTERNRYDAFCASHPSQNFEFNSQQAAAEEEAAYRRQYRQQYQRDFWEQPPRHRHSQSGPDETRLWLLLSSTSAIILILFVSPWWLLRRKQRRELERMVGKHELANSFLRQPEMAYRDDAVNREILARMFGDNIEDAIRQRREDPEYRLRRMRQDHFRERRARE